MPAPRRLIKPGLIDRVSRLQRVKIRRVVHICVSDFSYLCRTLLQLMDEKQEKN